MTTTASLTSVGHYSIRELTRLTGLSADVLRVWERRYGFPRPTRDESGARLYQATEVERLGLLQRALQRGHRVSNVIGCSSTELRGLLEQKRIDFDSLANEHVAVRRILEALCSDDDQRMVWELRYAALNLGARDFVRDIAAVLARVVGDTWQEGRLQVRHEHLLSDALTTQLRVIWSTQVGFSKSERVLLATLPGEWHALGIEMVGTYLAALGVTPRSMGPNTPPEEIAAAALALKVDAIAISVSSASVPAAARVHLSALTEHVAGACPILVGGALAAQVRPSTGTTLIPDWDALETWVRAHRESASRAKNVENS
jgi:MerR family transcriptional regulator, light-induced transcriptional regulator